MHCMCDSVRVNNQRGCIQVHVFAFPRVLRKAILNFLPRIHECSWVGENCIAIIAGYIGVLDILVTLVLVSQGWPWFTHAVNAPSSKQDETNSLQYQPLISLWLMSSLYTCTIIYYWPKMHNLWLYSRMTYCIDYNLICLAMYFERALYS